MNQRLIKETADWGLTICEEVCESVAKGRRVPALEVHETAHRLAVLFKLCRDLAEVERKQK